MEIKKGDVLLIHSTNITGRLIHLGMNIDRWRRFKFKPLWKKIYNHAAIAVEDNVLAEAIDEGVVLRSYNDAYGPGTKHKVKHILVYRPNWIKDELDIVHCSANQYRGVKYQFTNFIQYVPKVFFGIWLGKTHVSAEDRLYCSEYVALVMNKISHNRLFKKYWKTSPADIHEWCEKHATYIGEIKF